MERKNDREVKMLLCKYRGQGLGIFNEIEKKNY
jgi:hypothetical protein